MSKNVQAAIQLHSFHMLAKSFKLGFSSTWTENFQMYKLGFEEAEETDQIAKTGWIMDFQKNCYFCFIDYTKVFVWITKNNGKFLKRWECQITLSVSWETWMHVMKQQLELDMQQWTDSK